MRRRRRLQPLLDGLGASNPPAEPPPTPLLPHQLREFVTHGALVVPPDPALPPSFHEAVAAKLRDTLRGPPLSDREFWESLPLAPETTRLLGAPTVKGALEGLLGKGLYVETGACGTPTVHSHGAVEPGGQADPDSRADQPWHM